MITPRIALISLFALLPITAPADDGRDARARIADQLPGVTAEHIRESDIPGLYEVMVGPRVLYISEDGRYLVHGQVIDLHDHTNLTEKRRADARATWLESIPEDRMVIFEAPGETRHTITVFTDLDCSYCRALHADIDKLLDNGVRVRYLLYPRSGLGTGSAAKHDAVWCSGDRNDALTRAKAGEDVTAEPCGETPVESHLRSGRELGISGTPTTLTENGEMITGYLPPDRMLSELRRLKARHAE